MTHRQHIKEWLGEIELKNQFVIDWGSGSKPVSRYIKHTNCSFITIDQNELIADDRRSVTHFTHDIQDQIELGSADIAFCIEVLEHVQSPADVLDNIYTNLKPDGDLYLTVPFQFRIHSEDDYWRFTQAGITLLLAGSGFVVMDIKPISEVDGYIDGYLVKAGK